MDEAKRHKLIWGWLRFCLGFVQMSLVALSIGTLITIGVRPLTWAFVTTATLAALVSRLIYHGRKDPKLGGDDKDE